MNLLTFARNLLQLVLAPSKGWEDVAATSADTQLLTRRFLYPLMAVAALSLFVQLIYRPLSLPVCVIQALVIFVSYFVTYYFALTVFRSVLYRMCDTEPNEHNFTTVLIYSVSLLCLSVVICNLMPVDLGLKYLLPLAVALIMWKADVYLRVRPDSSFAYVILCIATTILPPILIQALFDMIL